MRIGGKADQQFGNQLIFLLGGDFVDQIFLKSIFADLQAMRRGIVQHPLIGFADAVIAAMMVGDEILSGRPGNFGAGWAAAVDLGINARILLKLPLPDVRSRQNAAKNVIGEHFAGLQARPEIEKSAAKRFFRVAADDAVDSRVVDDGDLFAG